MKTQHEDLAHVIWGEYRWRTFDPADLSVCDGTLEEAAEALKLDPDEVAWAIEEYGRCDTVEYEEQTGAPNGVVAWKPGPEQTNEDDEILGGGFEWPCAEAPRNKDER